MPELPEVETVMRGMERALTGKVIQGALQRRPDLRVSFPERLVERLSGQTITHFKRRAKYILMSLSSGETFILHLGMSGRVMIIPDGQGVAPEKHDHLVIDMVNGVRVIYRDPRRFGMVYMTGVNDDIAAHQAFAKMGPEPLGNEFSGEILQARLKNKKTIIKSALLDQRVVAGLGNIYVCEALYRTGINPRTASNTISAAKCNDLVRHIRDILNEAIKSGGSTLKDYRHTDDGLGYFQHQFAVYDREGLACPDCDCDMMDARNGIKRIVQAGRSSFYCPAKQK